MGSSYAVSDEFKQMYERSAVPAFTTVALKFERAHLSAKNEKLAIFVRATNAVGRDGLSCSAGVVGGG